MSRHEVAQKLRTHWLGRDLHLLEQVGSTNDEAASRARAGAPHGTVVIADAQSIGRGRQGHQWYSPPGHNLYLSAILRLAMPPNAVPPLTLAAGIATCEVARCLGVPASLKWPNDVLVGGRKLAGILAEMSTRGATTEVVILGVGMNVNSTTFPQDLSRTATSLRIERGGEAMDRADVLALLLFELERWINLFVSEGAPAIVSAWKERTHFLGQRVSVKVEDKVVTGWAMDVDADGALLLGREDGTSLRVLSGEVTLPEGEP
ncbi:MAG: biotin--[acetyl-CoA-carboxylase] ligase [Deltaproteobacteria bacterium]|nr:biotin--[acetyl-CoA-carboxylase] ligase [Deltaproteobacteria bacterium]